MKHLLITLFLIGSVHTEPMKINLVTTNDIHGMISSQTANFMNPQYPPTILGGAAFSKYVDELRDEANNNGEGLLILDGGNIFQGHPLGIADGGYTMIEWMNRIGYDAMVPGSYDFISGAQNLNTLSLTANFPFLFSNLICNSCPLISKTIKPYIIREISGIKIGILGVVNSQLTELALAENLSGTDADKEVMSIRKWVPEMKSNGAELIILLSSSGVPWNREDEYEKFRSDIINGKIDENASLNALQLAYYLEDVDFVVAGGNSKGYWLPWYDPHSHTYVMQGYGGGTEFSHIKLLVDEHSHLFMGYETVVDGKASQTLLADDFQSNREDVKWIKNKIEDSQYLYYSESIKKVNDIDQHAICNPAELYTDSNKNGNYDAGEPFTDTNQNGIWDQEEPFTDNNGNNIWDISESFIDRNSNGSYDVAENFIDINNNGLLDLEEPFTDQGNGVYDLGEDFSDINNNNIRDLELWYVDQNRNGKWDAGEHFDDLNNNGKKDYKEPYTDQNDNKKFDIPEKIGDSKFHYNAIKFSEPFTDSPNGMYDNGEEYED